MIAKAPTRSGDAQDGFVGEQLRNPLRVLITRDGEPVGNVEVGWRAENGGTMSPLSSDTDAEGIAASEWTLGPEAGTHTARATVTGAEGSPVEFTAEADTPNPPVGVNVQVLTDGGTRFDPSDITITVGQTVTWVWPENSVGHNVTPDDGVTPQKSGSLSSGPKTYSYTFNQEGAYRYYCEAHGAPNGIGMSGIVRVLTIAP